MAGLFFCLASTRCRAFILPCCNTAPYNRLQRVLFRKCNYTAHAIKQRAGLCRGFSCDCTRSTAHYIRPTQQIIAQPVTRWMVSQRRSTSSDTRYHRHAVTLYRSAQTAYYNNVYKRADHASGGGVSVSTCAGSARRGLDASRARRLEVWHRVNGQRGAVWHPAPGGAVQQQGHGGRRGTIGGFRRISFRAFAR